MVCDIVYNNCVCLSRYLYRISSEDYVGDALVLSYLKMSPKMTIAARTVSIEMPDLGFSAPGASLKVTVRYMLRAAYRLMLVIRPQQYVQDDDGWRPNYER